MSSRLLKTITDSPHYRETPRELVGRCGLKRHASAFHLWALGVGAVISGDFFGWNFGLLSGGFGGLLAALGIMTVLYVCLCFSLAEMSPALPHAGGAYSFARTALGPWCGYITGLAENIEYIFTPAVIVVGLGGYLGAIFHTPGSWAPFWWLFCYGVFVGLNILGVEISFAVSALVTLSALAVLSIFSIAAIPHFDLHRWALEGTDWLPKGTAGIFSCLPFALWVYLGIEQLPLAAEETHEPHRSMPKGILWALVTLIVFAFAVLTLNSGIAPGAAAVGRSNEPLFLGFRTLFGEGLQSKILALIACTGLIASFHAIIYAYGRQIYSLARAGYFPCWLSVTHHKRKTPYRALIAGSLLGFGAALVIQYLPQHSPVAGVLLNMAVFGAVLAYLFQMLSFVVLRLRHSGIDRPFRSPLGIAGALGAMAISALTFAALFSRREYRPGAWGALLWFLCGLLYFAVYARKRLILSPEEEFAVRESRIEKAAILARESR
ncbi:MAG: amino acid permease [Acidobacteriaceae bacterium]|nr:amino acid permease [Acidobacteriaceae bacterium]MBV9782097.1 amino acid permease [Acidobacteriaceae bacterium]